MKTFKKFISIYNQKNTLPDQGWIYIREEDFQDLKNATYFIFEEGELTADDYIETTDDIVPSKLYRQYNSITSLIENHIFKAIYKNIDNLKKELTIEEKIEALYHYVEEDTFLY